MCWPPWSLSFVVQSLSRVLLLATPWTAARQVSLSFTSSQSLLKLMSIESVMPSNHLILCRPVLLLPSISPSVRVFSNESALHMRWPKYWSFSFSISSPSGCLGLISFQIDWLDLLAVQGTLISSLAPQFKNINSWTLSLLYGLIFRGNIFVSLESWNENLIIQEPHFSIENISWFFSFFVEKQTVPLLSVLCQR